nr:MAG TPA: outer capsid protein sigma-1 attachment protein [Caudoviricetes sp.]
MDFEFAFKTLWGLATAAGWFWVNGISGRLKELEARIERLKEEQHAVKLAYATKQEAEADRKTVTDALSRLENKIDKLGDKLDRKADKA